VCGSAQTKRAGKTTLIKAIAGLLPPVHGTIHIDGSDVTRARPAEPLRHVGCVPEGRQLFTENTVLENLRLSARAAGKLDNFGSALREVTTLFPALQDRLKQQAGLLSGGEQQMVAMGRALVRRPRLLMLDEPTMGLAPRLVSDIRTSLEELRAAGLSILITENVSWLHDLVDSAVLLRRGRCTVETADVLLGDREALRKAYLGI
jgi:branched-chain amino acid transport system ATP-binding protein